MPEIKDLKVGDIASGKIGEKEYSVDGDTVTAMWLDTTGFQGTLSSLDSDIAAIDKDIAIRQTNRALRVAMREALVAAQAPIAIPEEIAKEK